jgi:hypothetical protein
MNEAKGDYQRLQAQKHFLNEIEQGIRVSNCEIIHKRIPALNKEMILSFAVAVGRLRARYLEAAFKLGVDEDGNAPQKSVIEDLRLRREMFEEARTAFAALRDAIEKGYVQVAEIAGSGERCR